MQKVYYIIVWWEYFKYEDGSIDVDGCDGYGVDHYEHFSTLEEAEQALPKFSQLDEDAHILTMEEG